MASSNKLSEILASVPKLPGIYLMKDAKDQILYIGKAKSLAPRVRSYFRNSRTLPPRTRIFLNKVRDIKFLTTKTEQEALILESNFIKKHKPRYNVLLKDDKQYPYLRLTTQETYPRLEVVRKIRKDGATYFGPYTMVKEVRETIRLIYKIFPLRQSRDALDGTPVRRPCLNFQMGRCLAPCAGFVSPEDYSKMVEEVNLFLKGRSSELVESLKKKMDAASADLRYEEAMVYRDKIAGIKTMMEKQKVISPTLEDQDVLACCREGDYAMVQVLIIRGGKMLAEKNYKMKSLAELENDEIISSFIKQYYADEPALPRDILLPHAIEDEQLISDWLSEKRGGRVRLEVPVQGKKRDLVHMAEENARFAMRSEMDRGEVSTRMLEELQETLELEFFPKVIEGFDISNISGIYAVGSMVYFRNAQAEKARYRSFKIREVEGIDDYSMLSEVMRRRYTRLIKEESPLPNLVLIDGGKGHLNTGYKVLRELGLENEMDIACIAKGKKRNDLTTDEVYLIRRKQPVLFRENSPARFLLQRIRDEAHRFAITHHKKLRSKGSLSSPLETIPGIGKKRRLMLLKHFGSLEKIRKASVEELKILPGITETLAKKISTAV